MSGSNQSKAAPQGMTRQKSRVMTVTLTDQGTVP